MRKLLTLLFVIATIAVLAACGAKNDQNDNSSQKDNNDANNGSKETIEWKFGHIANEDDVWHRTAEKFSELIEDKSDGQIKITLYPNSQLGGDTEVYNSIKQGTADITIIGGGNLESFGAPKAALMDAPYVFRDSEHMMNVLKGEIGEEITEEIVENTGVIPLYLHQRSPRNLTSNEPISTVEDLKGLKMRLSNAPLYISAWEAAGARPQVMDLNEVFTGLQQGVIDAQENPLDFIYNNSFYEVQEYVNVTEHVYAGIYTVVGADQYNSLNDELKQAVDEAAQEAEEYGQELFVEESEKFKELLLEKGMKFNEDVDKEAFREAMLPGVEEHFDEEQRDLYSRIAEVE